MWPAPFRSRGAGGAKVGGLVSVVLFAGLPGVASAEPYASFEALCMAADGDVAVTGVAARRMGWRPAPSELIAGYSGAGRDVVGFVDSSSASTFGLDGETVVHLRWTMADPAGGEVDTSACMLFGRSSLEDVKARIEAWAGSGHADDKGGLSWAYTKEGGAVQPVAAVDPNDYDALRPLLTEGPVYVLVVTADAGESAGLGLRILRAPRP